VASSAVHRVLALAAEYDVVTVPGLNGVASAEGTEDIILRRSDKLIIAGSTFDRAASTAPGRPAGMDPESVWSMGANGTTGSSRIAKSDRTSSLTDALLIARSIPSAMGAYGSERRPPGRPLPG
jgi:hypothetical protein